MTIAFASKKSAALAGASVSLMMCTAEFIGGRFELYAGCVTACWFFISAAFLVFGRQESIDSVEEGGSLLLRLLCWFLAATATMLLFSITIGTPG